MTDFQKKLLTEKKSNLQLYQDMILGCSQLSYLFKFEFCQLIASQTPGALGLFLRKFLYGHLFKSVGRNVVFGKNMTSV